MGADLISSKSWGVNFEKLIDEAISKIEILRIF